MGLPASAGIKNLYEYLRNKDNDELFVVNSSDLDRGRKRTEIMFNIIENGANSTITLYDTFIPVDIGRKVSSLATFSRSDDFMRLINRKFITVIDPETARKYMTTEEAADEQARIDSIMFGTVDGEDVLDSGGVGVSKLSVQARDANRPNASPKVASIMLNKTMEDDKRLSALKNMQGEITAEDIAYIMRESTDTKIKTWAQGLKVS